ncbi:hypothetical protein AYO45_02240 [Gammaproteobacteria bacterium SCGC AG-212-F23]|nr:hypothetical protein AYO45_02240 [Gammaproteobacteria bacterium SCGC AG-212-F23]
MSCVGSVFNYCFSFFQQEDGNSFANNIKKSGLNNSQNYGTDREAPRPAAPIVSPQMSRTGGSRNG